MAEDLVCFVDMDGYFIGERDDLNHMSAGEDDEVDNGPMDPSWHDHSPPVLDDEDQDAEPGAEVSHDLTIFEGMLDGWATIDPALVCAQNREHLWAILRRLALDFHQVMGLRIRKPRLMCHMGCGRIMAFRAFDDIPLRSLRCDCNQEWVIQYREAAPLR